MSILSLRYLLFSAVSGVFTWLFPGRTRKYTVALINVCFLYLLSARIVDVIYVLGLCVWTYFGAKWIAADHSRGRTWIAALIPAAGLCVFKYGGYFTAGGLLMPLGISFYTFKAISYLVDVKRETCEVADPVSVFDYLIFFPVFMAGPINRAAPFFSALKEPWVFDYRDQKNGFVQALLGLFEKLVIADQLAGCTASFLSASLSGWNTVFGVLLYSIHIYVDFDAYSNVAIGIARMMGFAIEPNFRSPYLSKSINEFWRRWHISLSSWIRDYIYIPLGGNRKGPLRKAVNLLIAFVVSGIWHGSTVLFLIWGAGHGILSILEDLLHRMIPQVFAVRWLTPVRIVVNFLLVSALWVFFRSATLSEAFGVFARMGQLSGSVLSYEAAGLTLNEVHWLAVLLAVVFVTDILRSHTNLIEWLADRFILTRWIIYAVLITAAIIFGIYGPGFHPEDFIYVTF